MEHIPGLDRWLTTDLRDTGVDKALKVELRAERATVAELRAKNEALEVKWAEEFDAIRTEARRVAQGFFNNWQDAKAELAGLRKEMSEAEKQRDDYKRAMDKYAADEEDSQEQLASRDAQVERAVKALDKMADCFLSIKSITGRKGSSWSVPFDASMRQFEGIANTGMDAYTDALAAIKSEPATGKP